MEQWLTNHQFTVHIGTTGYGFAKVSNLVQEQEYDSILEGGRNWSPVFFRKPKSKHDILILEKGVKSQPPAPGSKQIEVGAVIKELIITVGAAEGAYLNYTFDEGIVTKIELEGLNATGNEVLIRKIEIAHSGLRRMPSGG